MMLRPRSARIAIALVLASVALPLVGRGSAPEAPSNLRRPGELLDCSVEYAALATPESYVSAFNDVAGSYLAAQRKHDRLRRDPKIPSKEVKDAWEARVGAAQTMLRACHCWEQLDRVSAGEKVLAARTMTLERLKAEIGKQVARPCDKVFEAEKSGR
jgi:hypothetical protein